MVKLERARVGGAANASHLQARQRPQRTCWQYSEIDVGIVFRRLSVREIAFLRPHRDWKCCSNEPDDDETSCPHVIS
jgi:hypothetical protein